MTDDTSRGRVALAPEVVDELVAGLPAVGELTVATLTTELGEYGRAVIGTDMAITIEEAVALALATFLRMVTAADTDPEAPMAPVLEASYALGRGEAQAGRTMEALLAAYRIGARIAWEQQSDLMVLRRVPAATIARYAQLVFAYIDELSGASAAGHRDELATTGRVREQHRERLALGLLAGEPADELTVRAERAGWAPPETLTAVVLRSAHLGHATRLLDPRTLRLPGDVAPGLPAGDRAVLLVPDAHHSRAALRQALVGRGAFVGPDRPWTDVAVSYGRVRRAIALVPASDDQPVDTEDHLVSLVVNADPDALRDLQARVLAPFEGLRPATAERLTETLRSWLLHQGRRDAVAADLAVHAQTVRYRMTQVRELFGERLVEPEAALELTVALALPAPPTALAATAPTTPIAP